MEKELDEELARFLKEGPTAEELARVKAQHEANFVRGIERIGGFGGKSDRLAQSQVFVGSPDAYKVSLKRVQDATAEDLKAVANRWLSDGVYVLEVRSLPGLQSGSYGSGSLQSSRSRRAAGLEASRSCSMRHSPTG